MDWYFDVMGKSNESRGKLSDGVWKLRDKVCGNPRWYPEDKYRFLADPVKQSVDGEDWVWAVTTNLLTMYGIQISCPLSPPAPRFFRKGLAKRAKKCVETLRKGFDAEPEQRRHGMMTKWSNYLYKAKWGTKENLRHSSFTKVTQGKELAFFKTVTLMALLGGEPQKNHVKYHNRGIGPTKVFLTDDATFCAARPGMVAVTQGYRPGELSKSYDKYINAEIQLG